MNRPASFANPTADRRTAPRRTTELRRLIDAPDLAFLMEAHNGMSARIAEEAGFEALWASGLTISASLGLRDSNEASWTQVLETLEYMADATAVPILVDGDTGYGNFNSVRRLVRKLGERGIAGVCIEDKLFPKTNSFVGEGQQLAEVDEFCGRIAAGCDSRADDDFVIVARTEALISGRGMAEALARAEAYRTAGADAILIHSKQSTAAEIVEFAREWGGRAPLVIVPTMYYATPTQAFRDAGLSAVIWANHLLRSAMTAMAETARRIHADQSLHDVEGRIASVKEIFRITANAELEEAERRYLPAPRQTRVVILAASRGDLGPLVADRPKCLVDVRGLSVLRRLLDGFGRAGISRAVVVRGFGKEAVTPSGAVLVDNDLHAETGEAWSLALAREQLAGDLLVSYGDILFRDFILRGLLGTEGDIVVAIDRNAGSARRPAHDLVEAEDAGAPDYLDEAAPRLRRIAADLAPEARAGAWIGLVRFSPRGTELLVDEIARLEAEGLLEQADMPLLLTRLAARHPVAIHSFSGGWMDVNTLSDVAAACNFS